MSFILPEHRGRHLSRILYQARLDWIRAQEQFKRAVVSHRVSNEVSGRAMQHFGFRETHRARKAWPDGGDEDEVFYELNL
jgi:RimJ/RimL family protein N-acetyltransferase